MRFHRANFSNLAHFDDVDADSLHGIRDDTDSGDFPVSFGAPESAGSARDSLLRIAGWQMEGNVTPPRAANQTGAARQVAPSARNARPGEANARMMGPDSPFDCPPWQDYFFLAPNVRFTRTPDSDLKKNGKADEPQANAGARDSVEQGNQVSSDPVRAQTAAAPSPNAPQAAARPAVTTVPHAVQKPEARRQAAPEVRPAVAAAARRVVEEPAMPSPVRIAPPPAPSREARTVVQQAAPPSVPQAAVAEGAGSHLSDHVFFELMALDIADSPALRAPTATASTATEQAHVGPPAPVRPTVTRPAVPGEITSMYRVFDCRPTNPIGPAESTAETPATTQRAVALPSPPAPSATREARVTRQSSADAGRSLAMTPAGDIPPAPAAEASTSRRRIVTEARHETSDVYELPSEELLQEPPAGQGFYMSQERLEQNADLLESVLEDFGVRGEIIHVRPGPVVTLYEFEPAPGVKSSRVIGLADDIARSMSAVSARVAVVPGRNVIGIELPNETRETVYFRELIESDGFQHTSCKLALCLGKTIGGEPVIAELAKMPHLLVAGTTGSGKSVAINTMILSLLYRLKPEECRLIMVDPKMLELSAYDGIPHLLTPVVTDPKKAVTALKWAVREMEDRYRKMARLGVRNIDGYNQRAAAARERGETVTMSVQTGFEKGTGAPLYEEQEIDLAPMPYIVIIVDEMADLMMVAGKEIEGAIQRLAQMARAAGIHLIMATQRPSVDVITGTIKANFPTRISFQVTSKIDSRTILGEQGAEQLLGQGDMLQMAGGGRIVRVHGPFVSDEEVEQVVSHLKTQGRPEYLETVTADEEDEEAEADHGAVFDKGAVASEDGDTTYDEAVKVVLRDKKCSTSYIQRRLGIGYNRAASLVERMEKEGIVGPPNHVGKREIILGKSE